MHALQYRQIIKPTLNAKEAAKYSLTSALASRNADGTFPDSLERDVSISLAKKFRSSSVTRSANDVELHVPWEVFAQHSDGAGAVARLVNSRGMPASGLLDATFARDQTASGSAALMGESVVQLHELFTPVSAAARLGAQIVFATGKGDMFAAVTESDGAVFDWLGESDTGADPGSAAYSGKALGAFRLAGGIRISTQLLAQSRLISDRTIATLLLAAKGYALDKGLLTGRTNGDLKEPVGILAANGTNSVTFGAAASWAKCVDMIGECLDADVPFDGVGFAISTTAARKWLAKDRGTDTARNLLEWDGSSFRVGGFRCEPTTLLNTQNRAIFGRFASCSIVEAEPYATLIVDRYSAKKSGSVDVWLENIVTTDVRAEAFTVSSDSAAQ